MNRIYAAVLLVVFSFGLIAPVAFAQDPDAGLPECCRRAGLHRCSMRTDPGSTESSGPSFSQAKMKCPCYPGYSWSDSKLSTTLPSCAEAFYAELASHPALTVQAVVRYHVSVERTHGKRGPPTLL